MSTEFRVILQYGKGKKYSFPIKWLVNYIFDCTEYESLNKFTQKGNQSDYKKAVKAAQNDGIGEIISE